jgi:hypothetical protein
MWAHAARTWQKAWHGVLHGSKQDLAMVATPARLVERLGCAATVSEKIWSPGNYWTRSKRIVTDVRASVSKSKCGGT